MKVKLVIITEFFIPLDFLGSEYHKFRRNVEGYCIIDKAFSQIILVQCISDSGSAPPETKLASSLTTRIFLSAYSIKSNPM
jgi:ABC-type transport system involved in cytochrome bd biosynthesis fused ATPase/permease subunit